MINEIIANERKHGYLGKYRPTLYSAYSCNITESIQRELETRYPGNPYLVEAAQVLRDSVNCCECVLCNRKRYQPIKTGF